MSDDGLDLEHGDEKRAERISAASERQQAGKDRRSRSGAGGSGGGGKSRSGNASKVETELESRLDRTFDRIADALSARDDHELATAVREDKGAMSAGLVSLTRSVKILRNPLLMFLNFVEPVLAFGRVARILGRRFIERRQAAVMEQEAAAAEQETAVAA